MTTIPKITTARSGLTFRYRSWYARYTEDGKQKFHPLRTSDSLAAQVERDLFYAKLCAAGAVTAGPGRRAKGSGTYITERPPFVVRVPGRKIRYAASREQAEEIRAALKENETSAATAPMGEAGKSNVQAD